MLGTRSLDVLLLDAVPLEAFRAEARRFLTFRRSSQQAPLAEAATIAPPAAHCCGDFTYFFPAPLRDAKLVRGAVGNAVVVKLAKVIDVSANRKRNRSIFRSIPLYHNEGITPAHTRNSRRVFILSAFTISRSHERRFDSWEISLSLPPNVSDDGEECRLLF